MRVVVDFDVCESHGKCMELVPEVFAVRGDGCLYLLDDHHDTALAARLEAAATAVRIRRSTSSGRCRATDATCFPPTTRRSINRSFRTR